MHTNTHVMHTRAGAPDCRPKLTMVPDLRMAMKVGTYSMSNEIRTHLEATGVGDFTARRTKDISWHIRNSKCDFMVGMYFVGMYFTCVYIVCIFRAPDSVSYNTELCARLAGSDGLISAAPGSFHQSLPILIHLANQEGFWGVTMVTIQIHLLWIGRSQWWEQCFPVFVRLYEASTHSDINVDDISVLKLTTAGHRHTK